MLRDPDQRRIWAVAGPMILSNLSIPLLGMVDTAVVGHLPEPSYLGGVAVGATVLHFLLWAFGFLRMGSTGLAAQAQGAGDGVALRRVLTQGLALALGLAALVLILQAPVIRLALTLMDPSAEVAEQAGVYLAIRIWAAPASLANYVLWGWFLGLGNARVPLIMMLGINGLNAALDALLVLGLGMTADGVAAAALVAEYAGTALALPFLRAELRRHPGAWRGGLERAAFRRLLAVNGDLFIRTVGLLFAFAFFTAQGGRLGDTVLAANAVLMNFQTLLAYGLDGFAHAAEALMGQAAGAGDRARFRRLARLTLIGSLVTAGLYTLVYIAGGPLLVRALTGIAAVRDEAMAQLAWVVASPLISVWAFWLDGIFIGTTRVRELRNAMLVSVLGVYLPAWYLLTPLDNTGLWAALVLFLAARGVTLGIYYRRIDAAGGFTAGGA